MFTFQAWSLAAAVGQPNEVSAAFEKGYMKLRPSENGVPIVRFEVVDLRRGAHKKDVVDNLVNSLAELLLSNDGMHQGSSASIRLLFVGGARTLATKEQEDIANRAIKQDTEFYIRTLQNYGVAHYAGIGEGDLDSEQVEMSILSALIGISRHYDPSKDDNPATIQMNDRLKAIKSDFECLVASARNLPVYKYLGSADLPDHDANRIEYFHLLREIGVIYQFGKGDRPQDYSPAHVLSDLRDRQSLTFDAPVEHSSYELYAGLLDKMGKWAETFHALALAQKNSKGEDFRAKRLSIADDLAQRSFKLSRYELLRDLGRVLGQGTLQRFREITLPRRILLVDDELHGVLTTQNKREREPQEEQHDPIIRLLCSALASVGIGSDSVHVVPSTYVDAYLGLMQSDSPTKLLWPPQSGNALDLKGQQTELCHKLDGYLAILIDPESRHDPCGPVRVQRLHSFLSHRLGSMQRISPDGRFIPPMLAYSRKESSGYVQQCLNMGASAFVPKTRPYQLLFALSRALRDERREHRHDGQASQFRILKTLKPHVIAKLLRKSGPSFIHGGLTVCKDKHIEDPREARWIRNLPKADLHYHFGTAIPCDMVAVLAMNTAGHFLADTSVSWGASGPSLLLRKLADTLALAVNLEHAILQLTSPPVFSRMELLAAAAWAVQPNKHLANSPFGLGDHIIRHLLDPNDRCDEAHATALLVALMASSEQFKFSEPLSAYLAKLESLAGEETNEFVEEAFGPDSALKFEMEHARKHFIDVACRWSGRCTQNDFEALTNVEPINFWSQLHNMFRLRVIKANERLHDELNQAFNRIICDQSAWGRVLDWVRKNIPSLNATEIGKPNINIKGEFLLKKYVTVPDVVNERRSLQMYLRGADLLGSSHLQYPENLWIAAFAITCDNAYENIIYSEVRCETTGYTRAGMGAHDATDMLRHGFNLASLYISGLPKLADKQQKQPLVRTNILLAAKRHKSEGEARAVISLLEAYLERRAAFSDAAPSRRGYFKKFGTTIPPWWRPCDVVGFDLSGDESKDQPWLKAVIVPLAARSSPVTIHAGEAANAESIWRAVYELNALRIGHGLRLNEDTALLGYCVREGICMELCPNSNRYTNQLDPQPRRDLSSYQMTASLRYGYPLLLYLSQGMEVTLGTDNRYLHPYKQHTLTSEYLTAAELVGGLTRWEILQIVKAGFKNAFLDKSEVRILIESVEEEIYRSIATDSD